MINISLMDDPCRQSVLVAFDQVMSIVVPQPTQSPVLPLQSGNTAACSTGMRDLLT